MGQVKERKGKRKRCKLKLAFPNPYFFRLPLKVGESVMLQFFSRFSAVQLFLLTQLLYDESERRKVEIFVTPINGASQFGLIWEIIVPTQFIYIFNVSCLYIAFDYIQTRNLLLWLTSCHPLPSYSLKFFNNRFRSLPRTKSVTLSYPFNAHVSE